MKHTPTPWEVTDFGPNTIEINGAKNTHITFMGKGDNAAFIVHAVNTIDALEKSHAELLAALNALTKSPAVSGMSAHIRDYHEDRDEPNPLKMSYVAIANAQPVVTMLREGR